MKKIILTFLFAPFVLHLWAQQSIVPEVVQLPVTGNAYLVQTYPYILTQSADTSHPGNWLNQSLNTFIPSSIPGYKTKMVLAGWEINKWKDYSSVSDSFKLDNQNRFDVVIEDNIYNYPGFSARYKYRYKFTYNANGKPVLMGMGSANPPSSEKYDSTYAYKFYYDGNGRRYIDTMYYFQSPTPYISSYVYDGSGKVKAVYWKDIDPSAPKDTANKVFYTWSGDNILTFSSWYFDTDAGEYLQQGNDSFTYDNQNRVASHISYVWSSVNGSSFEMMPFINESYTYSTSGQLIEIYASKWNNNAWELNEKTLILYNRNDNPTIAFVYPYSNGSWSQTATGRKLFSPLTGISQVSSAQSKGEVWPNPAEEKIHLKSDKALREIRITDITGKLCMITSVQGNENQTALNITSLKPGIYWINWIDENQANGQAKFIKH